MKNNDLSTSRARMLRNCLGATLAVVAVSLSSGAFAVEAMGLKVVKDAQTGALRAPTAEEFTAMQAQENAVTAGTKSTKSRGMLSRKESPKAVHMSHGGVRMELTEDTMTYSVATRNADGAIDMQCVTGADAAAKAMNEKSTSATPANKEHKHDVQ